MRLLVCGGRDFTQSIWAFTRLDAVHARVPIEMVIEGGAKGADRIARAWAERRCVPVLTVFAEWDRFGKRAGIIRNVRMLKLLPDAVAYMPGGEGTAHMVRIAKECGVRRINLEKVNP